MNNIIFGATGTVVFGIKHQLIVQNEDICVNKTIKLHINLTYPPYRHYSNDSFMKKNQIICFNSLNNFSSTV